MVSLTEAVAAFFIFEFLPNTSPLSKVKDISDGRITSVISCDTDQFIAGPAETVIFVLPSGDFTW